MSALIVVYLELSSLSHLQCGDQFFVWAGTFIWADIFILYFLPFAHNPTLKVDKWIYDWTSNWIFIIFFTRIFAVPPISCIKLEKVHYTLFYRLQNIKQALLHSKWVLFHLKWHSSMGIQSKYALITQILLFLIFQRTAHQTKRQTTATTRLWNSDNAILCSNNNAILPK